MANPTGFIRDEELSSEEQEYGDYQFDSGESSFGPRDPDLDAEINSLVSTAPNVGSPTANIPNGPMIEGTDGLSVSDEPTIFSEPSDEQVAAGVAVPTTPEHEARFQESLSGGPGEPVAPQEQGIPGSAAEARTPPPVQQTEDPRSAMGTIHQRQADERQSAQDELESQQIMAQEREAENMRIKGEEELERLKSQKAFAQDEEAEHSAKIERLRQERESVQNMDMSREWSVGKAFADLALVIAAGLQGAIGQQGAIKLLEKNIDRELKLKMATRDGKLSNLADQLGSEDKARLAAKAAAYKAAEDQVGAHAKIDAGQQAQANAPLLKAELKAKRLTLEQEFENHSLSSEIDFERAGEKALLDERNMLRQEGELKHRRAIDWARLNQEKAAAGRAAKGEKGIDPTFVSQHGGAQQEAAIKRNELAMAMPNLSPKDRETKYAAFEKEYRPAAIQVEGFDKLSDALENAADGKDVAGFGRFAKYNANELAGKEGRALRQEMTAAMALYMNKISGAAVSEAERERMTDAMQGSGGLDAMRKGMELLSREARASKESFRGGSNQIMAKIADSAIGRTRESSETTRKNIAAQKGVEPGASGAVTPTLVSAPAGLTPENQALRDRADVGSYKADRAASAKASDAAAKAASELDRASQESRRKYGGGRSGGGGRF